jgi:hypothetical protein
MKKRCIVEMSDELAKRLKQRANQMELPVSGTIKLAISTLLDLADEVADGSTVVLEKNGHKKKLSVPRLKNANG